MKTKNPSFCVIAGLLALGLGAWAAVFPRLTAEELTAQSELILQGNIVRSWAAWDSEHKYIWTHYEVSVTNAIRGPRSAAVTISEPGGALDGINQQVSGVVPYSPGETAVLFLYQTPIGYWRAVGGPQGKFTVDRAGIVHTNLQAASYAETPGSPTGAALTTLEGLSLQQFRNRVQLLTASHPFRGRR